VQEDLAPQLKNLYEQAKTSKDPYFVALVGLGHLNRGLGKEGVELLENLKTSQKDDGPLEGASISITGSGGRDLVIETTALATLGWLKANRPEKFTTSIDKAVKWIGKQRGGYGGFGSTQSTILALKALIAYTKDHKKPATPGELRILVGDGADPVASRAVPATGHEPISLSIPVASMKPGLNKVRIEFTGTSEFPYTLSWHARTLKPDNDKAAPVQLTTKLQNTEAKEGQTVRLTAVVENKSGKGQGMTVAILGLPAGLEVPQDRTQLKNLTALRDNDTKPGVISAWELRGRELVLYWRDLAPDAKIEVNLDLVCRLPGSYRGPASRAYLYYNADHKFWTDPLAITIQEEQ
jgi:hypothetical protein